MTKTGRCQLAESFCLEDAWLLRASFVVDALKRCQDCSALCPSTLVCPSIVLYPDFVSIIQSSTFEIPESSTLESFLFLCKGDGHCPKLCQQGGFPSPLSFKATQRWGKRVVGAVVKQSALGLQPKSNGHPSKEWSVVRNGETCGVHRWLWLLCREEHTHTCSLAVLEPSAPGSCLGGLALWNSWTGPEAMRKGWTLAFLLFTNVTLEIPFKWIGSLSSHFKILNW